MFSIRVTWPDRSTNLYPANAMERVAEPAPSLALTTSSPPNWIPTIDVSEVFDLATVKKQSHTIY